LVLEDYRSGAAFRETDEGIEYSTLIDDLISGNTIRFCVSLQSIPQRVGRGTPARTLPTSWSAEGHEISDVLKDFIEAQLGRKIGVQLALPLHR
jgi:hypothetical protein